MSADQLIIESYKKKIRGLEGDLEYTKMNLEAKEKQLQIQKKKYSELQEQNKFLRSKNNVQNSPLTTLSSIKEVAIESKASAQLKEEMRIKDQTIKNLKQKIQLLAGQSITKDKKLEETETWRAKYNQLFQQFNQLKEAEKINKNEGADFMDSINISGISDFEKKSDALDFSFPQLGEESGIFKKQNHFVNAVENAPSQEIFMQKKQKIYFQESKQSVPQSLILNKIDEGEPYPISEREQLEISRSFYSLTGRMFSDIVKELSSLPPQSQWSFLNRLSIWSEVKMEELCERE